MHDPEKFRHAHFIGIGGIGISALAKILSGEGTKISGSDIKEFDHTLLPDGEYHVGHSKDNIVEGIDVVVFSDAAPDSNPERERAKEIGIPEWNFSRMLGHLTRKHHTIAVSGTHGKSTTTALLGLFLEAAGLDPRVFVGARVPMWNSNYRKGAGQYFVVEADEYKEHMMDLSPHTIVLTNLELDHPDYYRDIIHLMSVFSGYIGKLPKDGMLIVNKDDHNARHAANSATCTMVTYSIKDPSADLFLTKIASFDTKSEIALLWKGREIARTHTQLPGAYNLSNIAAAAATILAYNCDPKCFEAVLPNFFGIGRRFEILGKRGNTFIISDYAHHPTALRSVRIAAQEYFRGKRILFVFRPHQQERTRKLWSEYQKAIDEFDDLVLIEVYDVAGRESTEIVTSRDLLSDNARKYQVFAEDLRAAESIVRGKLHEQQYDAIVVIGAGDADKLARALLT